jgi:hypothetical protein
MREPSATFFEGLAYPRKQAQTASASATSFTTNVRALCIGSFAVL